MAQTKKKRSRKRRGTQGGRVDTNRRQARPQSRAEAKNRARAQRSGSRTAPRADRPPTWRSSFVFGLVASAIFVPIAAFIFGYGLGQALMLGLVMLVLYVPGKYFIDRALWRRREVARMRGERK